MPQRTVLSEINDIRIVAKDISLFSSRKQIFKAQLNHLTDSENLELEKSVVRYYSLSQNTILNILPVYILFMYLFLIVTNIISYRDLGIIPAILLYIPFAAGVICVTQIAVTWYAKKALLKLANDLEFQSTHYSFVMSARQK